MPLDQANAAYLEKLRGSGMPGVRDVLLPSYRALLDEAWAKRPRGPAVARVEDRIIATHAGPLPVRLYVPAENVIGAMVYMHGGGWTVGSVAGWDPLARSLATHLSCAILSVDFRLAPEHPFPAAIDDVSAALEWAAVHFGSLQGASLPLLIGGDSAGANLAAAAALVARDRGGPTLAMQLLAYPVVDTVMEADSFPAFAPPRLTLAELRWFRDQYLPNPADRVDPRASPGAAADLAGLPPTIILTAEEDILRAQGEAFGARLVAAGVPVTMKRYLGTMHGFLAFGDAISQSGEALRDIAAVVTATVARRAA